MKQRLLLSLTGLAAGVSALSALEIKLPADTARLAESELPGYSLAAAHCFTCHSTDYVRIQPPSSRAYWRANVVKMQKTFGAPIPDEAVEPIVEYLVRTYGTERVAPPSSPAVSETAKQLPKK
jgi:hypothetical protein